MNNSLDQAVPSTKRQCGTVKIVLRLASQSSLAYFESQFLTQHVECDVVLHRTQQSITVAINMVMPTS
jgi:hypothetical protein